MRRILITILAALLTVVVGAPIAMAAPVITCDECGAHDSWKEYIPGDDPRQYIEVDNPEYQPAWTEVVTEYICHPALTEDVYRPAVYEDVHHPAEYTTVVTRHSWVGGGNLDPHGTTPETYPHLWNESTGTFAGQRVNVPYQEGQGAGSWFIWWQRDVLVAEAWTETVLRYPAWVETIVVAGPWTEVVTREVHHPAVGEPVITVPNPDYTGVWVTHPARPCVCKEEVIPCDKCEKEAVDPGPEPTEDPAPKPPADPGGGGVDDPVTKPGADDQSDAKPAPEPEQQVALDDDTPEPELETVPDLAEGYLPVTGGDLGGGLVVATAGLILLGALLASARRQRRR